MAEDKHIHINRPYNDQDTGLQLLDNDISKIALKVELDDVPASKSYKQMQLGPFSEAFKATTPEFQSVMMPKMIDLMDIDGKDEIIKQMRDLVNKPSPDFEIKMRELDMKQSLIEAQIKQLLMQTTKIGTEAEYSAFQVAEIAASRPETANGARGRAYVDGPAGSCRAPSTTHHGERPGSVVRHSQGSL